MCVADVELMFSGLLLLAAAFSIAEDSLYFADFQFLAKIECFLFQGNF